MLKEAQIIVPADPRYALQVGGLIAALVREFGGVTETSGFGYWLNSAGVSVNEPVRIFTVACEPHASETWFRWQAERFGRDCDQEAVYVRFPDGTVEIIDTAVKDAA